MIDVIGMRWSIRFQLQEPQKKGSGGEEAKLKRGSLKKLNQLYALLEGQQWWFNGF